jgi:U3 small nucleolar RNA-associated protein 25
MAKKKSNATAKKGPKGKKARKASKLERQWGEEANEEEVRNAKFRKGKRRLTGEASASRVISKHAKIHNNKGRVKNETKWNHNLESDAIDESDRSHENSDYSDDDSSVENEELTQNNQFAFSNLMKKINKDAKRNNRQASTVPTSYPMMIGADSDDQISDDGNTRFDIHRDGVDSSGAGEDSETDYDDDDNDVLKPLDAVGPHPFFTRFNRQPLPENNCDVLPEEIKLKKIKSEKLHDDIVLQLSGETLRNNSVEQSMNAFSHVRTNLQSNWYKFNRKQLLKDVDSNGEEENGGRQVLTSLQKEIISGVSNYADTLITAVSRNNMDAINNVLILHALNHVLTANHNITSHNNCIRDRKSKLGEDIDHEEEWRDQGYARPKVLVLLPTRSTVWKFVTKMIELLGPESSIENLDRFKDEHGDLDETPETDERRKNIIEAKGEDWNELFGDHVNSDDDFKVGIAFSKAKNKKNKSKKDDIAMKIYSDFYSSDIIVASPLGLKMAITNDDEEEIDADFLSSIEVMLCLQSDVMLMQNWDHVVNLMERINHQPTKSNKTDFSRVRNYLLLGQAARWRQLIVVSRFNEPHMVSTFNRNAKSLSGRMKIRRKVSTDEASLCNVMTKVRQVFQRVPCDSFAAQGERRIKYFNSVILPQLLRTKQKHTLIYIPSYFDFVSVRNILLRHDIASSQFVSVTEYSRGTEVTRGRARFLQGRKEIMLYTGRAHFFMRHQIKGAKHLIMFGLPEHAEFYPELLNMLSWRPKVNEDDVEESFDISAPSSCLNLFTRFDAQSLERIVGTKHADHMVKGERSTYLFNS